MSKGGEDHEGEIDRDMETHELQTDSCGASMGPNQALHMWETVVKLGLSEGPLAVGPGSIPGA